MGIVRQLIQISVVEALSGRTLAGSNVHDSMITALPHIMEAALSPVILVSIEDGVSQSVGDGLFRTDVALTLCLQMAIAQATAVKMDDEDGDGDVTVNIAATDTNLEAMLNVLDRQWRTALSDPDSDWAEIFRSLVPEIGKISDVRLTDPETGVKHAARIFEITIHPIAEPALGQDDCEVVQAALAKASQTEDWADIATILSKQLSAGNELYNWKKIQSQLFTTQQVPAMIGVGTPDNGGEVALSDVSVSVELETDDG